VWSLRELLAATIQRTTWMGTPFIGRTAEKLYLHDRLKDNAVVQINGMQGIGKSRFVHQASLDRRCEHGCVKTLWIDDLQSADLGELLEEVTKKRLHHCEECTGLPIWIVLENLWPDAPQLAWIRRQVLGIPWLRFILIHDGEDLIPGAVTLPLGPLTEASDLISAAVSSTNHRFSEVFVEQASSGDVGVLIDLCAGIPAFLVQAARCLLHRSAADIVDEVRGWSAGALDFPISQTESLVPLVLEIGGQAVRQLSSTSVMAWLALSWIDHQFTLEQIKEVLAGLDVIDSGEKVHALQRSGLLSRVTDTVGVPRFEVPLVWRLLARYIARVDLDVSPWIHRQVHGALKRWWIRRVEQLQTMWFGPNQVQFFAELHRDAHGLPAVLELMEDPQDRLRIVAGLWPYWTVSERAKEGLALLSSEINHPDLDSPVLDEAAWAGAWLALCFEDTGSARVFIARMTTATDDDQLARRQQIQGLTELYAGNIEQAYTLLDSAAQYHLRRSDKGMAAIDISFLGVAASLRGPEYDALAICERAIEHSDDAGEKWIRGYVQWAYALALWRRGDRGRAAEVAADGVRSAFVMQDRLAAMVCLEVVAWYVAEAGDVEAAALFLGAAASLTVDAGLPTAILGSSAQHEATLQVVRERFSSTQIDGFQRLGTGMSIEEISVEVDETLLALRARRNHLSASLLTKRQLEIAGLVVAGKTNKLIAHRLGISVSTVETHLAHSFRKLGVASRAELVSWYVRSAPVYQQDDRSAAGAAIR
jgi:DNA-binding CsgD family transcriptional regulator